MTNPTEITAEETKLYDRQIRLWGMDAQKKLRSTRVLVVGLNGLSSEILKNVCLAGVASLTIADPAPVSRADLDDSSQFLIPRNDATIGTNKALACIDALRKLNPRVVVSAVAKDLLAGDSLDEAFFQDFDAVCLVGAPLSKAILVDELCIRCGIKFWYGHVSGLYGFFFSDLGEYTYIQENQTLAQGKEDVQKSKTVEMGISYPSLAQALKSITGWNKLSARKLKRVASPSLFAFLAVLQYESENNGPPKSAEDVAPLLQKMLLAKEIPESLVGQDVLSEIINSLGVDLSAVCAVLGGILGQEIIKVASGKDMPVNNFLSFDGNDVKATVI